MKSTCWIVALTPIAGALLGTLCSAAPQAADAAAIYKIQGDVFLESGDKKPKKLDAKMHNGRVLYAGEVIRCGKGGTCEIDQFEQKAGGEIAFEAKTIEMNDETATVIIPKPDTEVEKLRLDGGRYTIAGVFQGTSEPPPIERRKRVPRQGRR